LIELQTYFVFLAASLVINITPGPSVFYVTSVAMAQGVRAGILAALGLSLGILAHVLAAALGFSILLAKSSLAFSIMKYVGAAYLAYLGLKVLFNRSTENAPDPKPISKSSVKTFLQGAMVDLLNPKIAIFFLAFFPQFVVQNAGSPFQQIFVLGLSFIATGTTVNCIIAYIVGHSAEKSGFFKNQIFSKWLPGSVLILLSARMVTIER